MLGLSSTTLSQQAATLWIVRKAWGTCYRSPNRPGGAEAFADATGEQLTTKSDLRELGTDLRVEIASRGADVRAEIARQWADMRGEIVPVKPDVLLLKWMMGFILAFQIGIFAKLFMH